MNLSKRTTSKLPDSVKQHLNMYALAAGAAGVSVMALAQPSEAKIVYRPAHIIIGPNGSYNLDLNDDEIADFTFRNINARHAFYRDNLGVIPAQGNGIEGSVRFSRSWAFALQRGYQISSKGHFDGNSAIMARRPCNPLRGTCQGTSGQWVNVANRYLGLKFLINRKTHYGWARLSVQVRLHNPITATLTGYAYETIPGKSIKAGQIKEANVPTNDFGPAASLTSPIPDAPQPASLGMLALGAQGVPLWRRKEAELESYLKGALL
jgi:hypothetical protein